MADPELSERLRALVQRLTRELGMTSGRTADGLATASGEEGMGLQHNTGRDFHLFSHLLSHVTLFRVFPLVFFQRRIRGRGGADIEMA